MKLGNSGNKKACLSLSAQTLLWDVLWYWRHTQALLRAIVIVMLTVIDLKIFYNVIYFTCCQHQKPFIIFCTFLKRRHLTSVYYSTVFCNLVSNITNVHRRRLGVFYRLAVICLFCCGDLTGMDFPLHTLDGRLVDVEYRWWSDRAKLKDAGKIYSFATLFAIYPL
jgi:hypothetical protein